MNFQSTIRHAARPLAVLLVSTVLVTACKKDSFNNPTARTPAAGFSAFNLAPDQHAVGIALSGNVVNNAALDYTTYTGGYLPIYIGSREVRSFDQATGNTLAISNFQFADSAWYSAFLIGNAGNYRNVVVQDRLDSLTVGVNKTWIRFVNAIADSAAVARVRFSNNNENLLDEAANFATVSAFRQIPSGNTEVSVALNAADSTIKRTISFEANKVYTVLLIGIPASDNAEKKVQIKFVANGVIAE